MDVAMTVENAFDALEKLAKGGTKPGDAIVVECRSLEERESLKAAANSLLEKGLVRKVVGGGADRKELRVVIELN